VPRRLFFHIGSPKTGTTFLQKVLWSGRSRAIDHGLLLPGRSVRDHFWASLDLCGVAATVPGREAAIGAWSALVEEAAAWPGDVLISHETFAVATESEAQSAVGTLRDRGFDVHVVITARDLARQLPAHWQESVKARAGVTFDEFVAEQLGPEGRGTYLRRVQDYPRLVRAWGATLAPESVHVVTVPPSDAPRDLLWRRFAGLLGLPADEFELGVRANESLGVEQVELLRRLNLALGDRLPRPGPYPTAVKEVYAHRILAARPGTRLVLDRADLEFARQRAEAEVATLRSLGVDVVGDLDELLIADADDVQGTVRDKVADDRLLAEAVEATIGLLEVIEERRARHREDVTRLRDRIRELEASVGTPRRSIAGMARRARRRLNAGRRGA
jgi:hypothetical protein